MTEVLKILTGKYDTNVTFSFEKHQDCRTRGHNLKLVNYTEVTDVIMTKRNTCCTRIINAWNSLSESVISASTTDSFKNTLYKFCSNQDLIYDYKAELTGIGSRSFRVSLITLIIYILYKLCSMQFGGHRSYGLRLRQKSVLLCKATGQPDNLLWHRLGLHNILWGNGPPFRGSDIPEVRHSGVLLLYTVSQ